MLETLNVTFPLIIVVALDVCGFDFGAALFFCGVLWWYFVGSV
jgi:hypothetical protein